jgi:hypothetical protein
MTILRALAGLRGPTQGLVEPAQRLSRAPDSPFWSITVPAPRARRAFSATRFAPAGLLIEKVTRAVLADEGSDATMTEAYRVWVHL